MKTQQIIGWRIDMEGCACGLCRFTVCTAPACLERGKEVRDNTNGNMEWILAEEDAPLQDVFLCDGCRRIVRIR